MEVAVIIEEFEVINELCFDTEKMVTNRLHLFESSLPLKY